jgi:hypothetical protein
LSEDSHVGDEEDVYEVSRISFEQLDQMVRGCSSWISRAVKSTSQNGEHHDPEPIAMYVESGIGLFLHLAALLSMNIPVSPSKSFGSEQPEKLMQICLGFADLCPSEFAKCTTPLEGNRCQNHLGISTYRGFFVGRYLWPSPSCQG